MPPKRRRKSNSKGTVRQKRTCQEDQPIANITEFSPKHEVKSSPLSQDSNEDSTAIESPFEWQVDTNVDSCFKVPKYRIGRSALDPQVVLTKMSLNVKKPVKPKRALRSNTPTTFGGCVSIPLAVARGSSMPLLDEDEFVSQLISPAKNAQVRIREESNNDQTNQHVNDVDKINTEKENKISETEAALERPITETNGMVAAELNSFVDTEVPPETIYDSSLVDEICNAAPELDYSSQSTIPTEGNFPIDIESTANLSSNDLCDIVDNYDTIIESFFQNKPQNESAVAIQPAQTHYANKHLIPILNTDAFSPISPITDLVPSFVQQITLPNQPVAHTEANPLRPNLSEQFSIFSDLSNIGTITYQILPECDFMANGNYATETHIATELHASPLDKGDLLHQALCGSFFPSEDAPDLVQSPIVAPDLCDLGHDTDPQSSCSRPLTDTEKETMRRKYNITESKVAVTICKFEAGQWKLLNPLVNRHERPAPVSNEKPKKVPSNKRSLREKYSKTKAAGPVKKLKRKNRKSVHETNSTKKKLILKIKRTSSDTPLDQKRCNKRKTWKIDRDSSWFGANLPDEDILIPTDIEEQAYQMADFIAGDNNDSMTSLISMTSSIPSDMPNGDHQLPPSLSQSLPKAVSTRSPYFKSKLTANASDREYIVREPNGILPLQHRNFGKNRLDLPTQTMFGVLDLSKATGRNFRNQADQKSSTAIGTEPRPPKQMDTFSRARGVPYKVLAKIGDVIDPTSTIAKPRKRRKTHVPEQMKLRRAKQSTSSVQQTHQIVSKPTTMRNTNVCSGATAITLSDDEVITVPDDPLVAPCVSVNQTLATTNLDDTSVTLLLHDTSVKPHLSETLVTPLLKKLLVTPRPDDNSFKPLQDDNLVTPHLNDTLVTPHLNGTLVKPITDDICTVNNKISQQSPTMPSTDIPIKTAIEVDKRLESGRVNRKTALNFDSDLDYEPSDSPDMPESVEATYPEWNEPQKESPVPNESSIKKSIPIQPNESNLLDIRDMPTLQRERIEPEGSNFMQSESVAGDSHNSITPPSIQAPLPPKLMPIFKISTSSTDKPLNTNTAKPSTKVQRPTNTDSTTKPQDKSVPRRVSILNTNREHLQIKLNNQSEPQPESLSKPLAKKRALQIKINVGDSDSNPSKPSNDQRTISIKPSDTTPSPQVEPDESNRGDMNRQYERGPVSGFDMDTLLSIKRTIHVDNVGGDGSDNDDAISLFAPSISRSPSPHAMDVEEFARPVDRISDSPQSYNTNPLQTQLPDLRLRLKQQMPRRMSTLPQDAPKLKTPYTIPRRNSCYYPTVPSHFAPPTINASPAPCLQTKFPTEVRPLMDVFSLPHQVVQHPNYGTQHSSNHQVSQNSSKFNVSQHFNNHVAPQSNHHVANNSNHVGEFMVPNTSVPPPPKSPFMDIVRPPASVNISPAAISTFFGRPCYRHLRGMCKETQCNFSHKLQDAQTVFVKLHNATYEFAEAAYNRMVVRHRPTFEEYFRVFCVWFGERKYCTKLVEMLHDCEQFSPPYIVFYRHIVIGLIKSGLALSDAVRMVFKNMKLHMPDAINELLDIVVPEGLLDFCDELDSFSKIPNFSFKPDHINHMIDATLKTKNPNLVQVLIQVIKTKPQTFDCISSDRRSNFLALLSEFTRNRE